MRFCPEPEAIRWQQMLQTETMTDLECTVALEDLLLLYAKERAQIRRDEWPADQLGELRQLAARFRQVRQDREALLRQLADVKQNHQASRPAQYPSKDLKARVCLLEEQLESTSLKLGWLEWRLHEPVESPTGKGNGSFAPRTWWQTRTLLQQEKDRLQQALQQQCEDLLGSHAQANDDKTLARIENRLKWMERSLQEKLAAFEQGKMKIEWLRQEKDQEVAGLKDTYRQKQQQLNLRKEELQSAFAEQEAEARRPRNTLRHWMDQHVPDWQKGPGKVIHPKLLNSRGLLPKLERINDLFFGIRLHLDDLDEIQALAPVRASDLQGQVREVQQSLAELQIRFQHEEKNLNARYRQKIRPLQKTLQQAEYNLQIWKKELAGLRQRARERTEERLQLHEKKQLGIRYAMQEYQEKLNLCSEQLAILDQGWESWLEDEDSSPAQEVLQVLYQSWQQEKVTVEKQLGEAREVWEASRQAWDRQREAWEEQQAFLEKLEGLQQEEGAEEEVVASFNTEKWVRAFQVCLAEERACLGLVREWAERIPGLLDQNGQPDFSGLDRLAPEQMQARKKSLARKWFEHIPDILDAAKSWMEAAKQHSAWTARWAVVWKAITQSSDLLREAPALDVTQHAMFQWLKGLQELQQDHQHAVAGPSLFNTQDPDQTLIKTIHILDNLHEAWMNWQDQRRRWAGCGFSLSGLDRKHQSPEINRLYHLSLLIALAEGKLPGPVQVAGLDGLGEVILRGICQQMPAIILSQWPWPVSGQHLWVTQKGKNNIWEALPFAVGAN